MEDDNIPGTESRLWELYVLWCRDHGVKPKVKDYLIWLDDRDIEL